jgi:hypothetical protein
MNFNHFLPGKAHGLNLLIGNKMACEQIIELSIDQSNYTYSKREVMQVYPETKLVRQDSSDYNRGGAIPFVINDHDSSPTYKDKITNSEIKNECWYIENPVSKELTKRITLKLGPKSQQQFVVVVKAPMSHQVQNMLSLVNVGLLTFADERFGVDETFENMLAENYDNSMREFLSDRKKLAVRQRL